MTRASIPAGHRAELPGLRAVAALLVVVYHVWLGRVSGGVDVFFVVSGFLLAGQVVRGPVLPTRMWSRMAARLLPSAATVLLATVLLSVLLLPENRWFQAIREVTAAALFVENWQLVRDSADYFAQHDQASVVQHFWSLSVQGQYFLLFPAAAAGLALVARRRRWRFRTCLGVFLAAVFGGSLAYSVWLTRANQPLAYFGLATRLWEFALGGLLALVIFAIVLPRPLRVALGWLGVAALVACGLVLRVGTVFPGYAALWPTLAGAAVLVAGRTGSRYGADRLLASRALGYLGGLSFALYLWHWPVLVLFLVVTERPVPGVAGGAFVVAMSLLLAAATHHLVEVPARSVRLDGRTALRLAAVAVVPVLLAAGTWQLVSARKAASYALAVDDPDHPGARALDPDFEYWGAEHPRLLPPLVNLAGDWASTEGMDCVMSPRGAGLEVCRSVTTAAPGRRVVVVGDSHPAQYVAALRPVAEERDWQLVVMTRGACPFSTDSEIRPGDRGCLDWAAAATEEIVEERPDLVFTTATRDVRRGLTEHTPPGYVARWRMLAEARIPVLAVRDNPRHPRAPAECVRAHGREPGECATPRAELYAEPAPYASVADVPPNVAFLDLTDRFCDAEQCPAVIGNVLVYMDDNHLSATYLASMAPAVAAAVDEALAQLAGHSG